MKCSITKDSIVDHNLIIPEKAPSVIMNLIVSCISKLLLALEQRAKGYKNKPYAKDVLLTSGMTVGASFAFVSLFSISLSCGATVDSLTHYNEAKLQGRLDEKKRKEDEKAMKKKEQKDKH